MPQERARADGGAQNNQQDEGSVAFTLSGKYQSQDPRDGLQLNQSAHQSSPSIRPTVADAESVKTEVPLIQIMPTHARKVPQTLTK